VYTVAVEGDSLVARHRRHGRIPLTAADAPDEFRGGAWFFQRLRFVRGADGRVAALLASNGPVRDLRLERQE
jgi:hypothetical protein